MLTCASRAQASQRVRGFRNSAVITGHVSFCPLHVPSAARCTVQNTHWWSGGPGHPICWETGSVFKQWPDSRYSAVHSVYLSSHQPLGPDVPLLQITPSKTCERPDGSVWQSAQMEKWLTVQKSTECQMLAVQNKEIKTFVPFHTSDRASCLATSPDWKQTLASSAGETKNYFSFAIRLRTIRLKC